MYLPQSQRDPCKLIWYLQSWVGVGVLVTLCIFMSAPVQHGIGFACFFSRYYIRVNILTTWFNLQFSCWNGVFGPDLWLVSGCPSGPRKWLGLSLKSIFPYQIISLLLVQSHSRLLSSRGVKSNFFNFQSPRCLFDLEQQLTSDTSTSELLVSWHPEHLHLPVLLDDIAHSSRDLPVQLGHKEASGVLAPTGPVAQLLVSHVCREVLPENPQ